MHRLQFTGLSQILFKHCGAVQNSAKIFQGGSGASCCRLAYKITAVCGHVKGGGLSRRSSRPLTCRLAAGQSGMRSAFGMVSPYVRFLHAFKKIAPYISHMWSTRCRNRAKDKGKGDRPSVPLPFILFVLPARLPGGRIISSRSGLSRR